MNTFRTIVRPVAFALSIAFASAPLTAFADEKPGKAQEHQEHRGEHAKKGPRFPMKADAFRKHVEKRMTKVRAKFEKILEKRDLPADVEAQMKKDFDAGLAKVRAAVDKAAADGTVTKEEAKEVRDLAKEQRKEMRGKHADKGKRHDKRDERREKRGS